MRYKYINDRYTKARGGESHIYQIDCSHCGLFILLYQKDGIGTLYRMYIDRIIEPQELIFKDISDINKISPLVCSKCGSVLAVPIIYAPEKRFAFRILRGSIRKKLIQ
jgi:ribosomal protein S27E